VYLTYIKPILRVNAEENMNEVFSEEYDTENESISVNIKFIDKLRSIVMGMEMSENEDEIEERRIQAGVTLEIVKTLLNGNPIALYVSKKTSIPLVP
jgi:hypothetical protein